MANNYRKAKAKASNSKGKGKESQYGRNNKRPDDHDRSNCDVRDSANKSQEVEGKMYNDPSWRIYNDMLGTQVASFPLTTFVGGKPADLHATSGTSLLSSGSEAAGIWTIGTVFLNPSVGYGDSTFDAINQAALKMYTEFSSSNMKTTQYGPQDIIACILALGEVMSLASYIRRAVGFAGTTNPRNWLYPRRIVQAMGIDWDDLQKNVGIYREQFNYMSAIASAIAFPANLDYFKSCASLYNDVFLDHTSGMAQAYICVPASTWILNETASQEGSRLDTYSMPYLSYTESADNGRINAYTLTATTKLSTIMNVFKSQLDALMNSATLQYLYADVLKFVNNNRGSLVTLPIVQDGYSVVPVYSEEFLINIENCDVMGIPSSHAWEDVAGIRGQYTTKNNDVELKAGTNTVKYAPAFTMPPTTKVSMVLNYLYANAYCNKIFNFHKDDPTTKDRIMAARFKSALLFSEVSKTSGEDTVIDNTNVCTYMLPDHYVVDIVYYKEDVTSSGALSSSYVSFLDGGFNVRDLEVFSHPPVTISARLQGNSQGVTTLGSYNIMGELDVYTTVDHDTMKSINDLSILSLFTFTK